MPVILPLDCFWILRANGSPKELQGFVKTWRTGQRSKRVISCIFFFHRHSLPPYSKKAKPHFGAALVRSAHDCETRLMSNNVDSVVNFFGTTLRCGFNISLL